MTVKINLKAFIEELFIAINTNNEEDLKLLSDRLEHFFSSTTPTLTKTSLTYMFNHVLVKGVEPMEEFITSRCNFLCEI